MIKKILQSLLPLVLICGIAYAGTLSFTTAEIDTILDYFDQASGTTGTVTTNIVFSTSPTLTTPTISGALTISEGALTNDSIVEADLKAVNAAVDEDILTYESTTGDFEWHTPGELITSMDIGLTENYFLVGNGSDLAAGVTAASAMSTMTTARGDESITDYSATSTITGWSSYTTKKIYYMVTNGKVDVWFHLSGTSNSATTSFTVPYALDSDGPNLTLSDCRGFDSGSALAVPCRGGAAAGSSTVGVYTAWDADTGWTASGTKTIVGHFYYIKDGTL